MWIRSIGFSSSHCLNQVTRIERADFVAGVFESPPALSSTACLR